MPKLKFAWIQLCVLLMILIDETSTNNEISQKLFPWENGKPIEEIVEAELLEMLGEFLSEGIVQNTTSKVCVRIPNPDAFDLCIDQPYLQLTKNVRELLVGCSSRNYTLLKEFIETYKDKIESIDLMIFSKCLNALFEVIMVDNYNDFIRIILPLIISPSYYHARLAKYFLFKYVSYIKRNALTVKVLDRRFIFKAWNPFVSNISGFFIIPKKSYTELQSIDQFNGIGQAVYIPSVFLNDTTANEKMHFHVIIFLLMKTRSWLTFSSYKSILLAVDISKMCVNFNDPIIGIAVNSDRKEFKLGDLDLYGCAASFCDDREILIINVDRILSKRSCLETTISNNYSTITWRQTPIDKKYYYFPENLCIDVMYIPTRLCKSSNVLYIDFSNQTRCIDELSSNTKRMYQLVRCCRYNRLYCQTAINIDTAQEYIDVTLLFHMYVETRHLKQGFDNIPEIVDKGLQHLKTESPIFCEPIEKCVAFHFLILIHSTREANSTSNIRRENFVFTWYNSFPPVNFILRKNQYPNQTGRDYQMLTDVSTDYSTDINAETIVRISNESAYANFSMFIGFIIPSSILTRNAAVVCRSKMVVIFIPTPTVDLVNCSIYVKTIDDSNSFNIFSNEEYWYNLEIKSRYMFLFCISEPKGNVCNNNKKVTIYEMQYQDNLAYEDVSNVTVTTLDILSQLATSMNPDSKQASLEHRKVFKMITYIGSGLSLIGIFFILISAAILEKWFSDRYNITQLSITLALENIFVLLDHKSVKHIGYLIFFYSVLAQFAWMLLIGYHQYQKFIKVFDVVRLDMTKSLILGWLSPALILLIPSLLYKECFECDLCYKNQDIFNYFVLVPICCALVINLIVYIGVMYNISKDKSVATNPAAKRAKIRALILFPFLLGLSWISILILFMPSVWISLSGSYVFHIVTLSQGFVLFIFTVFLDEHTKKLWRNKWDVLFKKGPRS